MWQALPLLITLAAAQPAVTLVQKDANDFAVVYAPWFDASNYTWAAQSSTDLVHWVDWPQTDNTNIDVKLTVPVTFIRLVGEPVTGNQ